MAQDKVAASIAVKLDAQTASFNKKTDEVNNRLKRMETQNKSFAKNLKSNFLMITGAVAAFSGAVKLTKDILASTQTTGDKLTYTAKGLKVGLESVFENIATLDIKSIASDWEDAYRAAYLYSQALDDIGDQSLAISIRRAEGMADVAKEKWQMEKAINEERYDDALVHSQNMANINREMLDAEQNVLDNRLTAWNDMMMGKEGITAEEVDALTELIRNYDLLAKEMQAVQKVKDLEAFADGKKVWVGLSAGGWIGPTKQQKKDADVAAKEHLGNLTDIEKGIYDIWGAYDKMTDEERKAFAEIITQSSQLQKKNLNLLASVETKEKSILNLKEAQVKAEQDENAEMAKGSNSGSLPGLGGLLNTDHGIVSGPVVPEMDMSSIVNPAMEQLDTFNEKLLTTADIVYSLTDAYVDMFSLIGETLIEGQGDWTDYAQVAIKALQQVIGYMLGAALAKIVEKGAEGGPIGAAIALASGLAILGIASSQISKMNEKKYALGTRSVEGSAMYGDQIPALLNPNEMIINPADQNRLWNMIQYGGGSSGGQWETANVDIGLDKLRIGLVKNAQIRREL